MLWEPAVGGSYIPMCLTIIQEKLEYTPVLKSAGVLGGV